MSVTPRPAGGRATLGAMRRLPGLVLALVVGCGGSTSAPIDSAALPIDASPDAASSCSEPFPAVPAPPAPPYAGTAFLDPDIITATDPTSFVGLTANGQAVRTMFDRRTASFNQVNAWLFDARFGTTVTVEIQVNPEFTAAEAETEARFYAAAVGRIPAFLFRDIRTFWIHKGVFPFGGGNDNLLIHTGQGADYVAGGWLEEIFVHEASHTSLDASHAASARWIAAQEADGTFISTYARDNPTREDVGETMVPYVALRFRSDRVDAATLAAIRGAIPSRLAYLDCLNLTFAPVP